MDEKRKSGVWEPIFTNCTEAQKAQIIERYEKSQETIKQFRDHIKAIADYSPSQLFDELGIIRKSAEESIMLRKKFGTKVYMPWIRSLFKEQLEAIRDRMSALCKADRSLHLYPDTNKDDSIFEVIENYKRWCLKAIRLTKEEQISSSAPIEQLINELLTSKKEWLSSSAIASKTGIPERTVSIILSRAGKKDGDLRKPVENGGGSTTKYVNDTHKTAWVLLEYWKHKRKK